jgi:probable addiction module antidote protein
MTKTKKTKKYKTGVPYDEWLIKQLKDRKIATEYLNNAIKEGLKGDKESLELLLMALRNVIQANGGFAKISKKAGLGRESLYKVVSKNGNPEFRTITALTSALGLELRFM